jgi:hypothetical protein
MNNVIPVPAKKANGLEKHEKITDNLLPGNGRRDVLYPPYRRCSMQLNSGNYDLLPFMENKEMYFIAEKGKFFDQLPYGNRCSPILKERLRG